MITIWHNPRCSKSRATLALIEEHTASDDFEVRRYLEDAPSEVEIRAALAALNKAPIEVMRTGEKIFKELGLTRNSAPEALVAAMAAHPILIERPIVLNGEAARIGRPPDSVLEIL